MADTITLAEIQRQNAPATAPALQGYQGGDVTTADANAYTASHPDTPPSDFLGFRAAAGRAMAGLPGMLEASEGPIQRFNEDARSKLKDDAAAWGINDPEAFASGMDFLTGGVRAPARMPEQIRAARAAGIDPSRTYYHGTERDFDAPRGTFFITDNPHMASKFADSSLAQKGTTGGRVMPLWINHEGLADLTNPEHLDRIANALVEMTPWQGRTGKPYPVPLSMEEARQQLADPRNISEGRVNWAVEPIIDAAKRAGFSGVPVRERWGGWGAPDSHSIAMFPENAPGHIRSPNAEFNPEMRSSSNLLAGIAGLAAVPALAGVLLDPGDFHSQ